MSIEKETPEEYSQKWWADKVNQCEKELDDRWRLGADKIVDIYLAEDDEEPTPGGNVMVRKYNVFWANTQIIKSALYATPPKPKVARQFGDAKDDVARTAALILERILNFGMNKDQSDMHNSFTQATEDRLIPGLGQVWLRYEVDTEEQMDPATGQKYEAIAYENVSTDYVHWRDFFWSPARTWNEVWWVGRRVWLTKSKLIKRFGKELFAEMEKELKDRSRDNPSLPKGFKDGKYEIIELWCRETNKAYWFHRNFEKMLDEKDDPLQLDEFFPCPKPLLATHTSKTCIPRPEYAMSQDQYEELNVLNTRIYTLTESLRVVGVFDKTQAELANLFKSPENRMIAVDQWGALAEKGGLKGVVDWFPVEVVAQVLEKLMVQRQAVIQQIYELTSISDIMRGASNPRETLGAQKLKSQYSSVRLQLMQQDVGMFVRHAMRIKAEIVSKHFQPETIKEISQIGFTESAMFADQAIQLLKNYQASQYRIEVSEETLSIADYNAERELRTEYLTAVGQFLSQSAQMSQAYPQGMPYLLRMIQWLTSSFRGSSDIESVLDEAVNQVTNNPPKPQEEGGAPAGKSPQELQLEAQKTQMELQADAQKTQMTVAADAQKTQLVEQNKLMMAREANQTKVLIEQMKLGQAQDELAVDAIGVHLDHQNAQADRDASLEQAEADRSMSAEQHAMDLDHAAEQGEADRQAAARKQSKSE